MPDPPPVIIAQETQTVLKPAPIIQNRIVVNPDSPGGPIRIIKEVVNPTSLVIHQKREAKILAVAQQGPAGPQGLKGDKGNTGAVGPIGPIGPAGPGDKYLEVIQENASELWVVQHNLGKKPSVITIDSGGTEIIGDIEYVDDNLLNVRFVGITSGTTYLN